MKKLALLCSVAGCTFAVMPATFAATPPTVANPICTDNTAFFDPGNGQNIVVPSGYTVSVFKSGLNFPTGIAFRRARQGDQSEHGDNSDRFDDGSSKTNDGFEVFVLESGHGLPSRCNEQDSFGKGQFDPDQPFHAGYFGVRSERQADRQTVGQAYCQGWPASGRPGSGYRVRERPPRRTAVRDRFEPGDPCGRAEQ